LALVRTILPPSSLSVVESGLVLEAVRQESPIPLSGTWLLTASESAVADLVSIAGFVEASVEASVVGAVEVPMRGWTPSWASAMWTVTLKVARLGDKLGGGLDILTPSPSG
jgi:hypothetical protein